VDRQAHARRNLSIIRWLVGDLSAEDPPTLDFLPGGLAHGGQVSPEHTPVRGQVSIEVIPAQVQTCNFWLLAAEEGSPHAHQAWFQPDGEYLPIVGTVNNWMREFESLQPNPALLGASGIVKLSQTHPISHYLLLPVYAWGAGEWDINALKPWLQRGRVTIGFSANEARLAERVTVLDTVGAIPDTVLDNLRLAGCVVERATISGTQFAP
jgi:hypothetical protein